MVFIFIFMLHSIFSLMLWLMHGAISTGIVSSDLVSMLKHMKNYYLIGVLYLCTCRLLFAISMAGYGMQFHAVAPATE